MAESFQIIRIKRSDINGDPLVLANGELAYSALLNPLGNNGGETLYIGAGVETDNNSEFHLAIGGTLFTRKLLHTPGVLTPNAAIVVDENSKIDLLKVGNLTIDGNTISSTNTNGSIALVPNGSGSIDASNSRITNAADPINPQDVVTKRWLQNYTTIEVLGTVTSGTWEADIISTAFGGTGLSAYNKGDLLYASETNVLSKLASGEPGSMLMMGDDGAPYWSLVIDGGSF